MDRALKAIYVWIVFALVWMGLELLLYGEIQPRIVDDIMWFLFLLSRFAQNVTELRAKRN